MAVYGRHKITVNVIGVNGMKFCISGDNRGDMGVSLMDEHVGLIDTPVETIWSQTSAQIGASFGAARFQAREVTLPVALLDSERRSWQKVDSLWRKAWSYREDSLIEIISESGRRVLKCRLAATPEATLGKGGQFRGVSQMLMHLKAGDPLWYDEDETDTIMLGAGAMSGAVTVENPTDQPMWLRWVISGGGSVVLPDFSWETRDGYPGFEHQDRRILMPHQPVGVDVSVDTDPEVEQVVAVDHPVWGAKMNGQFFNYPVPAWTPPTMLPVALSPLPFDRALWQKLFIPQNLPADYMVALSAAVAERRTVTGDEPMALSIASVAGGVSRRFEGDWAAKIPQALTEEKVQSLLDQSGGVPEQVGVQVRQVRRWSRPYGLE